MDLTVNTVRMSNKVINALFHSMKSTKSRPLICHYQYQYQLFSLITLSISLLFLYNNHGYKLQKIVYHHYQYP